MRNRPPISATVVLCGLLSTMAPALADEPVGTPTPVPAEQQVAEESPSDPQQPAETEPQPEEEAHDQAAPDQQEAPADQQLPAESEPEPADQATDQAAPDQQEAPAGQQPPAETECEPAEDSSELPDDAARSLVGDFELEDLDGHRVRLTDHAGKVIVLSFWATWCTPCQQELPFLQQYLDRYRDQGFMVIAIAMDGPETLSRVRTIVRRNHWTMPVLLDQDGSVTAVINPRAAAPFTLFLDRSRRLVREHEGYTSGDEIGYEVLIRQLLAEPAP
ncbi:MAG: redoxin domain-containing protein [Bradymonadales bacterium]|nr:redoxin domain-containing protein [Bradymonadales bacterium]